MNTETSIDDDSMMKSQAVDERQYTFYSQPGSDKWFSLRLCDVLDVETKDLESKTTDIRKSIGITDGPIEFNLLYKDSIFRGKSYGGVRKEILEFLKSKGITSISYHSQLDCNIVSMLLARFDRGSIEERGLVHLVDLVD